MRWPKLKLSADWWLATLSSIVGTVIGIVLTLGTNLYFDKRQQRDIEHTVVLMVISNIDDYVMKMDEDIQGIKKNCVVINKVLKNGHIELKNLDAKTKNEFVEFLVFHDMNAYDHSTEKIFSSSIETWKNIESPLFLSKVGKCYSLIHTYVETLQMINSSKDAIVEKYLTEHRKEYLSDDKDLYELTNSNEMMRYLQKYAHYYPQLLEMEWSILKQENAKNKLLMNISQEEYNEFEKKMQVVHYKHSNH